MLFCANKILKATLAVSLSLFSFYTSAQELNLYLPKDINYNICIEDSQLCTDIEKHTHRFILPQFTFDHRQLPPTKNQWRLFWVLQAIDVYATATALDYDCVTEVNPIFGNRPSTTKLIEIKSAILSTSLLLGTDMTSADIYSVNTVYTYIAVNNLDILYRARKACNKVR
jgi:hypothetical protein